MKLLNVEKLNKALKTFRTRLAELRNHKKISQAELAKLLNYESRATIANWESDGPKSTLPPVDIFLQLCNIYGVDPNYLLGFDTIPSKNNYALSESLNISVENVRQLRNDSNKGIFIDNLMTSLMPTDDKENKDLFLNRIRQICHYEILNDLMTTTFTSDALPKIRKAYNSFYQNTFPLDMSAEVYKKFLPKQIPMPKTPMSEFVKNIVTENEYNNILWSYPDFEEKSEIEKYNILIDDIADKSYDYFMGQHIVELAKKEVTNMLEAAVNEHIRKETAVMRHNLEVYAMNKKTRPAE